jgi:hypothetical protein
MKVDLKEHKNYHFVPYQIVFNIENYKDEEELFKLASNFHEATSILDSCKPSNIKMNSFNKIFTEIYELIFSRRDM